MEIKRLSDFYDNFDENTSADSIKQFVQLGGSLNEQFNENGWTLLNVAIEHNNLAGIKALIKYGSIINVQNSFPPLFHALDNDIDFCWQANHSWKLLNFSMTIMLLNFGANSAQKNSKGHTIRDEAALYGNDVIKIYDKLVVPHCSRV